MREHAWDIWAAMNKDSTATYNGKVRKATPGEVGKANINTHLSCENYLYAPIGLTYHFKMNAEEAKEFTLQQRKESGVQAESGDYAVLVAMHINTKKISYL